jgi:DNA-binding NarL/FixJ family response regulator
MSESSEIRIMLADDHAMLREGLAAVVSRDPELSVVGQCGDGLAVLEQVRDIQPDVLVLDITMPGLNGLDLCREITRRQKDTAILILTMHSDEQFAARALENGASGYLVKDAASEQLTQAVRTVARGELYLGPGIPRTIISRLNRDPQDPYDALTLRERQVLQLVAEGKTNRQIAEELSLAVKTIDTHRTRLMRKLGIHDQTALVKYALKRGLVTLR